MACGFRSGFLLVALLPAGRIASAELARPSAAPASPAPAKPPEFHGRELLQQGHRAYFDGRQADALKLYECAAKADPRSLEAWLNGGIVWEDQGKPRKATEWFRRAAELAPSDTRTLTAFGWALWKTGRLKEAEASFESALRGNPKELYAVLGLGRVALSSGRTDEALRRFSQAEEQAPLVNTAHFWKAQAHEAEKDWLAAADSYKKAALNDSYFTEARYAMARDYVRAKKFNEAYSQLTKILDVDPSNRLFRGLRDSIQRRATRFIKETAGLIRRGPKEPLRVMLPEPGDIPMLRIGIGTTSMGKPLPRQALGFKTDTQFSILDARTDKLLASGEALELWQARISKARPLRIEVFNHNGKRVIRSKNPIRIQPDLERGGTTTLKDISYARGYYWTGVGDKTLRGSVELSFHPKRKAMKIVDVVDLESYTHGVLAAEMPITSPLEALKAQSVIARSHALYIKLVTRRHAKDGYDICDEQHCQVYSGVGAETERSRMVVNATRGRIVAYRGKIAHVIYSSNCGGHTEAGKDVAGWGDVPYWQGIDDAPPGSPPYPRTPWELRWWLKDAPPAFCAPSGYVHPSHYRWTRVIAVKDLEEKMNRKEKVGRLLGLVPLKRAASGHINSILVVGSRRRLKLANEMRIRSLLGLGSQRSTLFTVETEYDKDRKPETFVFHGAGWGHAVGMCQSGAMGRAEQGQSYADIIKAYYPGTELGNLRY